MTTLPSLAAIFFESLRIGAISLGPAAALHHIRRRFSDNRGWAAPDQLDHGRAFLDCLPGGTPAQLCGFVGLSLRGIPGALAAFAGFILPGFLLMAGLGALYSRFAGLAMAGPALAGIKAAIPTICLIAGVSILRTSGWSGLLLALACGSGTLFFIGLKPFSMLLGGGVIGVLLLKDPEGLPPAPTSIRYGWRMPISLFTMFSAFAASFFLMDPALGRFFLSVGKAEIWSFGGFGAFPLLFADAVRTRHWLDAASFADLISLAQLAPGPLLSASALAGTYFKGFLGAVAALTAFFTSSFFVLLAAAPASETIASCAWARKAVLGVKAVLGGITLGMAALFTADMAWDLPRTCLALASLLALVLRVHPALVVLGSAAAGLFLV